MSPLKQLTSLPLCLLGNIPPPPPPSPWQWLKQDKVYFLLCIVRKWEIPASMLLSRFSGTETPFSRRFSHPLGVASIIMIHNGCLRSNCHFPFQKGGWGKGRKEAYLSVLRTCTGNHKQDITSQFTQESIPRLYWVQIPRLYWVQNAVFSGQPFAQRQSLLDLGRKAEQLMVCCVSSGQLCMVMGHPILCLRSAWESEPLFLSEETLSTCAWDHAHSIIFQNCTLVVRIMQSVFTSLCIYGNGHFPWFLGSSSYSIRAYSLCLVNNKITLLPAPLLDLLNWF